jgi:hypothetical protein
MEPSNAQDNKLQKKTEREAQKKTERKALTHKEDRAKFVKFMIENRSSLPQWRLPLALVELYKEQTGVNVPVNSARKFLKRDYKLIGDEAFVISREK